MHYTSYNAYYALHTMQCSMHTVYKITKQVGVCSIVCIAILHTMQEITNQTQVCRIVCIAYHAEDYQVVRPPPPACSHLVPPHKRPLHQPQQLIILFF